VTAYRLGPHRAIASAWFVDGPAQLVCNRRADAGHLGQFVRVGSHDGFDTAETLNQAGGTMRADAGKSLQYIRLHGGFALRTTTMTRQRATSCSTVLLRGELQRARRVLGMARTQQRQPNEQRDSHQSTLDRFD